MTVQTGLRRAGGKSVLGYLDPVSHPSKGVPLRLWEYWSTSTELTELDPAGEAPRPRSID